MPAPTDLVIRQLIGANIKRLRQHYRVTQKKFAKDVKCSRTQISNIEAGTYAPGYPLLYRMASVLGVELGQLLPAIEDIPAEWWLDQIRKGDYEIGHSRPPHDNSWKPGTSGNPAGRPPRRKTARR